MRERWRSGTLRVRRFVLLRRRLIAALCAGGAVLVGVQSARPAAPATDPVLVATHDLASGVVLDSDDLQVRHFAEGTAPDGVVPASRAVGRTLAAPLRTGEPITDLRLVGDGLLAGYQTSADADLRALPVRVPDAGTVGLLRVGDRIDLYATDPQGGGTEAVALDVPVLALPQGEGADDSAGAAAGVGALGSGRLVVIGCSASAAADVADATVRSVVTVALVN